jgi:acetyl esterase/lipase
LDIAYGPGGRYNLLDIWRHPDLPAGHRSPVLVQVPGGAWSVNDKRGQAYPLMSRMVELGWTCVSINYSRSPRNAWPAHIVDVKRAIAWVRDNIAEYGGDPGFIAMTGGSAGAHLSSLAALTANDPKLQPGFEDADTTVQAVVPYYGVYDLTNVEHMHQMMQPFLEQFVMRAKLVDDPGLFE